MSLPASKNKLESLSQSIKVNLEEVQSLIPMLVEQKKSAEKNAGLMGTISSLIINIQDVTLGSCFIITEIMSLMRCLIDTKNEFEKRYYIKWLNHSFCEAYVYFNKKEDGKDVDGVWLQLKSEIKAFQTPVLTSNIKLIDQVLEDIEKKYCNWELRRATSHFNEPQDEFIEVANCNNEDRITKGVSSFLSLHMKITELCSNLTTVLLQLIPKHEFTINANKTNEDKHFIDLFNNKLSEAFNKDDKLISVLNETIAKCAKELDGSYKSVNLVRNAKDYALSNKIELKQFDVMYQLAQIRMTVAFMKGDLACSIKSYLHSENNTERASNLRRINLVETAILTKLYGYNEIRRTSSLWVKLREFDGNFSDDRTQIIEFKLNEITKEYDKNSRNLNTHFREGKKLNIVERYDAYSNMNHADLILHCLELVNLCKDLDHYTMSVLCRQQRNLNKKSENKKKEWLDKFEKMRDISINSNSSVQEKRQIIEMIDKSEQMIEDFFNKVSFL